MMGHIFLNLGTGIFALKISKINPHTIKIILEIQKLKRTLDLMYLLGTNKCCFSLLADNNTEGVY